MQRMKTKLVNTPAATASFRRIGIIGKRTDVNVAPTLRKLIEHLATCPVEVLLDDGSANHLPQAGLPVYARSELGAHIDLAIVVGGDGTLLDAARTVGRMGVPLLGVNLGRVGFLVDVRPEVMHSLVDEVLGGVYIVEKRLQLEAVVHYADGRISQTLEALNDAVIRNRDFARVLEFDTFLDDCFISRHRADGIIIATPTGSTAYALSGGGPVLHPALEALALVPICPHTLSDRPLIVEANHQIDVVVNHSATARALVSADGQSVLDLGSGDRVRIQRADNHLTLLHPQGYDYFKILRTKLQWGRGQKAVRNGPDTRIDS